jgi:hypothetical protein
LTGFLPPASGIQSCHSQPGGCTIQIRAFSQGQN